MYRPYDWLKSGVRCYGKRLISLADRRRRPALSGDGFDRVLRDWGISDYRLKATLGGSTGGTFLIETAGGMRVLRRSDSDEGEWVAFQLAVLRHLRCKGFPFEVPQPLPTAAAADWHFDGRDYWYLYAFIKGLAALEPDHPERARALGTLVGHFTLALRDFAAAEVPVLYHLPLFQPDETSRRLADDLRWFAVGGEDGLDLARLVPEATAEERAAVAALPLAAVYYDWHNKNIVTRWGVNAGLIDYDSLAVAPRIVDFQNALTYVMISRPVVDAGLVSAFARGYRAVHPLSAAEIALVHPVMVDRVGWLLAHVLAGLRTGRSRGLELRAERLLRLLRWLADNRDRLTALIAPAQPSPLRLAG